MALQSNQQGFLVGERIVDGIDLVHKDISQILELMTQGYQRSKRNAFIARNVPNQVAANDIGQVSNTNAQGMQKLPKQLAQLKQNQAISSAIATNDIGASVVRAKILRQAQEPAILERDAKGRFVSGKQETDETKDAKIKGEDEQDKKDSVLKKILTTLAGKIHAPDSEHIDPTIDTLKEIGAFKAIGLVAGAGSWLLSLRGKKDDKKADKEKDQRNSFSFLGTMIGSSLSKLLAAAVATVAVQQAGVKVNEVIQSTDTGRNITDTVGSGIDHIGAFFGNKDAQDRLDLAKGGDNSNKRGKAGKRNNKYDKVMLEEYTKAGITGGTQNLLKAQSLVENQDQNPLAKSPVGAFGNTQFMPDTAKQYGVKHGDSDEAVRSQYLGQAKYMTVLLKRYHGDNNKALAAYNYGEGNFDKAMAAGVRAGDSWMNHVPKETSDYVKRVNSKLKTTTFDSDDAQITSTLPASTIPANAIGMTTTKPTKTPLPSNPTDLAATAEQMNQQPSGMNIRPAQSQAGMSAPQIPPKPVAGAVPAMPTTQKQLNTPMPAPQTIPASNDSISQNLSDRDLAHAVTGGLGMSRWMG
jgi:hypothetical protein